jgi:tripartite-type tricarboxylate transporter receptor subunit TctC
MFKDLLPAGLIVDGQLVIVANVKVPYNSVREMIDYAKKNPGKVTWSLPTRSGEPALYGYLLRAKTGIEVLDVAYKGSGPQSTAVIAGEVDIGQFAPGRVQQLAAANQVKPLAISGNARHPQFPNVPTMKELGIEGIKNYSFGLYTTAGTPAAIVNRLNAGMIAALKDPGVVAANAKFGFNPIGSTPAEHAADMKETFEDWKLAAKIGKVQPE